MAADMIFEPLRIGKNLEAKSRIFRSSASGCSNTYGGSGVEARINRNERFARVLGAITTSFMPIGMRGRILLSAVERSDAVLTWEKGGNSLQESIQACRWARHSIEWARAAGEHDAERYASYDELLESVMSVFQTAAGQPAETFTVPAS
jgi:hypothetical protein